jgi:hypothetical protein
MSRQRLCWHFIAAFPKTADFWVKVRENNGQGGTALAQFVKI